MRVGVDVAAVKARYADPARRYHTVEHLQEVLAEVSRLAPTEPDADVEAVGLAALYHDAIYDVRAGGGASEDASARLAAAEIRAAGGSATLADEVARLIRLTAGHSVDPADRSGGLLVDADLWILSSPPERYDRYVHDVRAEYAHVPDDAWRHGRGDVLARFLAAGAEDVLFHAGPADDRRFRTARAITNLTRERSDLTTS